MKKIILLLMIALILSSCYYLDIMIYNMEN